MTTDPVDVGGADTAEDGTDRDVAPIVPSREELVRMAESNDGSGFDGSDPRSASSARGVSSNPGVPPQDDPTAQDKVRAHAAIREAYKPGKLLTPEDVIAFGQAQNWSARKSRAVFGALADDLALARLSDGHYLFVDIAQHASEKNGDARIIQANHWAQLGLDELNFVVYKQNREIQLAGALAKLGEALRRLSPRGERALRAEVESLYRNVAMELSREILATRLRRYLRNPAGPDRESKIGSLAELAESIYYDGATPSQPIGKPFRKELISLLSEIKADPPSAPAERREAAIGYRLLHYFLSEKKVPIYDRRHSKIESRAVKAVGSAAVSPSGDAIAGAESPQDPKSRKSAGPGTSPAGDHGPSRAPVITLAKIYFPNVGNRRLRGLPGTNNSPEQIRSALAQGGYFIGTTRENALGPAILGRFLRKSVEEPGGAFNVEMEFLRPVRVTGYHQERDGPLLANVESIPTAPGDRERLAGLAATAKLLVKNYAVVDPTTLPQDLVLQTLNDDDPVRLTNRLAQELPFSSEIKQRLLQTGSDEERLQDVLLELAAIVSATRTSARAAASNGTEDVADPFESLTAFETRLKFIGMPEKVREKTLREFKRFLELPARESESQKLRTYIEWLIDLPWSRRTKDVYDLKKASEMLDADHAGLEFVKDRILQFLAVRKRTGSTKGAIICLVGPPGVGKTTIASSIAAALGRKFVRLSLGGAHDEAVLRGHLRTYQGSMPGGIIRRMKDAGTVNPVFLLDEVDKIEHNGSHGDPAAAMLEMLDPKQNDNFRDLYMDVPYDLSEVLFVVTANDISLIPKALRNRMEIIEFPGYTQIEKLAIAERHLLPIARREAGFRPTEAQVTSEALRFIIDGYTQEPGARKLEEQLKRLMEKIAYWSEHKGRKIPQTVGVDEVREYLGSPLFHARNLAQNGVGLAAGLAVDDNGGSIINVEVTRESGKGELRLRKQFGPDIEDSAVNALKFVKEAARTLREYGIVNIDFQKTTIDINFTPAGKIDGPSAGSLMVTAIISALTRRPVKAGVAMTGEISAFGEILPIGGLVQKVIAAHRMGFKTVIYPADNRSDIAKIPEEIRREMTLIPVRTYDEVFAAAFDPLPAVQPETRGPKQAARSKRSDR